MFNILITEIVAILILLQYKCIINRHYNDLVIVRSILLQHDSLKSAFEFSKKKLFEHAAENN